MVLGASLWRCFWVGARRGTGASDAVMSAWINGGRFAPQRRLRQLLQGAGVRGLWSGWALCSSCRRLRSTAQRSLSGRCGVRLKIGGRFATQRRLRQLLQGLLYAALVRLGRAYSVSQLLQALSCFRAVLHGGHWHPIVDGCADLLDFGLGEGAAQFNQLHMPG